jgi:hypothetical protein
MKKDKCVYFWCVEEKRDGSKKLTRFFISYVCKCATTKFFVGQWFFDQWMVG